MSRHPYTYAAYFIRQFGPVDSSGVVLSRSDAAQIRQAIAEAIGMEDEELAVILSNEFQNSENDPAKHDERVMKAIGL